MRLWWRVSKTSSGSWWWRGNWT